MGSRVFPRIQFPPSISRSYSFRFRVRASSRAKTWSAISGPIMILALVKVMLLSFSSGKWTIFSTPALVLCTHLSFLPWRRISRPLRP